jgi:serine/threonine protein kinase/Cu/Zn superoxide dismutase
MSMMSGDQLQRGDVIGGYRIDELISRGGMGVVYRARHIALNRVYALKVLAPELAQDEQFQERFKREMRIAASLHHRNIVEIHYAGDQDGLLFFVMDFVTGTDLRQILLKYGALEPTRAVDILQQCASALDAAHHRGLVHRDVKPGNILITVQSGEEHAYLTDFGLARRFDSVSALTKQGLVVGTVDYMAPEQITGEHTDARTDIYGLGCVFYQMLTGSVPYERKNSVATLFAQVHDPPPPLAGEIADTHPAFEAVLEKAMAKDASDRYLSAGDFASDAEAALQGERYTGSPTIVGTGEATPMRRVQAAAEELNFPEDVPSEEAESVPEQLPSGELDSGGEPPQPTARPDRTEREPAPTLDAAAAGLTTHSQETVQSVAPDSAPPVTPDSAPPVTPDSVPPVTPDSVPPVTPDSVPPVTPDSAPPVTPDSAPPVTPDSAPSRTPDTAETTPPDSVPEAPPPAEREPVVASVAAAQSGDRGGGGGGRASGPAVPAGGAGRPRDGAPTPTKRSRVPILAGLGVLVIAAIVVVIVVSSGGSSKTSTSAGGQQFLSTAQPVPTNRVTGSGAATVVLHGNTATVTVDTNGLLNDAPHAMHIHAGGLGVCPPASAARKHNGHVAIDTGDGLHWYGPPQVSLTTSGDTSAATIQHSILAFSRYPDVGDIRYTRTVTIPPGVAAAIRANNAVIVVHGINYDGSGIYDDVLGQSDLNPGIPSTATAPALCGPLVASTSADAKQQGDSGSTVFVATLRKPVLTTVAQAISFALLCHLIGVPTTAPATDPQATFGAT